MVELASIELEGTFTTLEDGVVHVVDVEESGVALFIDGV